MSAPRRAEGLIRWAVSSPHLRSMALQDLGDEHRRKLEQSRILADLWYWGLALQLVLRLRLLRWPRGIAFTSSRNGRSPGVGEGIFTGLPGELRRGLRSLWRSPAYTCAAVLTLALGIGATTAVFSVVDDVLLRPLPFAEPEALMAFEGVRHGEPLFSGHMSYADLLDWREAESFAGLAIFHRSFEPLVGHGEPRLLESLRVTANYFDLLGLAPEAGRFFLPEENELGHPDVVVLSYRLWSTVFAGDRSVLGQTIDLDGEPHVVVGVAPAAYEDPFGHEPWLWTVRPPYFTVERSGRTAYRFQAIARLAPGVTRAAAQADVDRIAARLAEELPQQKTGVSAHLVPVPEKMVGSVRVSMLVLAGAVALLLSIIGVNVAHLALSRGSGRRRESALRVALGANRLLLARQQLAEGLWIAAAGAALGLVIGLGSTRGLLALSGGSIPRWHQVTLDPRMLAFSSAVSLLCVLFCTVLPTLFASASTRADALRSARAAGDRGARRLRGLLVIGQTALALVLLTWSGLLGRSLASLMSVDPGLEVDHLTALRVAPSGLVYDTPEELQRLFDELGASLRHVPGVAAAGATNQLPMVDGGMCFGYLVDHRPPPAAGEWRCAQARTVTAGYLEAAGMHLVRGRPLSEDDRADRPPVILINEALARLEFPDEDPIGRAMTLQQVSREIVGVVRDVRDFGLAEAAAPTVYSHLPQEPADWAYESMVFVLRTDHDVAGLPAALRQAVWTVDDAIPIPYVRTLRDVVASDTAGPRFRTVLITAFGASALALAAVGLFGVMAFSVARRRREIAVRMALGARRLEVLEMILRQGLGFAILGAVLGTGIAWASSRWIEGLIFGIDPLDPWVYVLTPSVLLATCALAALLPALRAAGVEPARALHAD